MGGEGEKMWKTLTVVKIVRGGRASKGPAGGPVPWDKHCDRKKSGGGEGFWGQCLKNLV